MEEAKENTSRRDHLLAIQEEAQRRWADEKIFEVDAPAEGEAVEGKFTANFPYPYMNGVLHLGHAFSLSKVEFATAFHRLCGKKVLFPQGFHCTGMPIKASADKVKNEIEQYGNPPNFPPPPAVDTEQVAADAKKAAAEAAAKDPTKFGSKKSKATAKQGAAKYTWDILASTGVPIADIPKFSESMHWLEYFPPLAIRDLTALGCGIDWRRSFITTDVNPYYDSFIQWQFRLLKKQGKITKAKRYAVYSPKDGQPCADHDRASGEGAIPQEYTLIKMRALELHGKLLQLEGQGPVFLMAATLRPETMAGQTNCWALPEGDYGAFRGINNEIYVMTARAARNLSYQDRMPVNGRPEVLLQLKGQDLIGLPLHAPNSPYERIYVLPLLTILTNKGTGVVTSVPSDSPDDYAALTDLKKKPKLREKFGVKDKWVLPYEVIPIIDIPGFGDKAAEKVCADLKIQSQNDTKKLEEAKKLVYLKGFTDGVMVVGPYKGSKVKDVKDKHKADLLSAGEGILYSEPDKLVMSRSGDECVVALTDQWYLDYGEEQWLELVRKELAGMELYQEEARHQFESVLGWLHQWACSRSFGLGTKIPWDPAFLIESLSDSTIYMAYYTLAHFLQQGDIFGRKGGGISAKDLTDEVWDFIFLDGKLPSSSRIPVDVMHKMRREFNFWYPFDLRASGKDLIQNHLTFCLYNHVAIWPDRPDRWPRSFRCNGHLMIDSEKMSKSTGNFKTLEEAIKEYSADATRLTLASSGDTMDDANFEKSLANSAILRLTKELAWIEETLGALPAMRHGGTATFVDRAFDNEMNIIIHDTKKAYETMLFYEVVKRGYFDLQKARDTYRQACETQGMDRDLVMRYIEVSTLLLTPICPHQSHHIWSNLLKRQGSVLTAGWPHAREPDATVKLSSDYLEDLIVGLRKAIIKAQTPAKAKKGQAATAPIQVKHAELFVAEKYEGWRATVLGHLSSSFNAASKEFREGALAGVLEAVQAQGAQPVLADKKGKETVAKFAKFKADQARVGGAQLLEEKLPFHEKTLLEENTEYLLLALKLESLAVQSASQEAAQTEGKEKIAEALPGEPALVLRGDPITAKQA